MFNKTQYQLCIVSTVEYVCKVRVQTQTRTSVLIEEGVILIRLRTV
jgi:hypothetical protein